MFTKQIHHDARLKCRLFSFELGIANDNNNRKINIKTFQCTKESAKMYSYHDN